MMTAMFQLMLEYGIRFPRELTLAMKALAQSEEIARILDPEIDIVQCAYETGQGLMVEQITFDNVQHYITRTVRQSVRRLPKLQQALDLWVKQFESGKLTIHLDNSDTVSELKRYRTLGNRAISSLVLVGMIISSTIAMSITPSPSLTFIPILGALGFVLGLVMSIYLLMSMMLRHDGG
jgi:ubiquinone biosynthesis protein